MCNTLSVNCIKIPEALLFGFDEYRNLCIHDGVCVLTLSNLRGHAHDTTPFLRGPHVRPST